MATIGNSINGRSFGYALWDKKDQCAAAFCLLFFAPLIVFIYLFLLIEIDAAFIVHRRLREDGSTFKAWRFRIAGLLDESVGRRANPARRWLRTLVGAFLYTSELEIFPTLYNVLRGEISLQEMLHEV